MITSFLILSLALTLVSISMFQKSSLTALMVLEIMILNYLLMANVLGNLGSFKVFLNSFLVMTIAVLAATMGLCLMSTFSKSNEGAMEAGSF